MIIPTMMIHLQSIVHINLINIIKPNKNFNLYLRIYIINYQNNFVSYN
jgi:hypothetical protein